MEDEIDIARRAVGQVVWKYFQILNSYTAIYREGALEVCESFRPIRGISRP
jgi:hypothetical protein